MLRILPTRYTTWLLCGWCAYIGAWLLVDGQALPLCGFGWLRCGLEGAPGSLWLEPTHHRLILVIGGLGVLALAALAWFEGRYRTRETELVPSRPRTRTLLVLGAGTTLLAAHLVLFSPVVTKPLCAQTVRLNSAMAYPLNCDSPVFLDLAHHPGKLLQRDNPRQSRPGYVYLGAALTTVLGPVGSASGLDRVYGTEDTAYLPLVLINLLAVAAAIVLFSRLLLGLGVGAPITGLLATVLAINDVTKAYYWSPHQAMFTLLVPVLTIVLAQWMLRTDPGLRAAALVGLGLGLGMLVYGSFVIPIAVAGLLLLRAAVGRPARPRAVDRRALARLAVFGGLAVVPTLVWIAVCQAVAGSYFNNETVVYHEFVWLPDAIGAGWAELRHTLATTGIDTSVELLQVTWLPAALLAALVVAAVAGRVRLGAPSGTQARAALAGTLLTGLVTVVFLFAIGFWAYRITYTIIPTMLVAIGWVSARLSARSRPSAWAVGLALGAVVVAWVAFQLLSGGPYS